MRIFKFYEIDSTNKFLKDLNPKENFDLVIAKTQTQGVGRRGNTWQSEEGGAYFSFVLKEDKNISTDMYSKLSLVIGYSLLKTLESFGVSLMFKWTNDIYFKDRKLSGILIEKKGEDFIIGIGVNIYNTNKLNNKNLKNLKNIENTEKISLKEILESNQKNNNLEIDKIILEIIENIKTDLNFYFSGGFDEILKTLNSKNYLLNREVAIELTEQNLNKDKNLCSGIAKNIEEDGTLRVEIEGKDKFFNIGEIHIKK